MFNLSIMFFRTNFCLFLFLGLSACFSPEKTNHDTTDPVEIEESLYQIALNDDIPGASKDFKEVSRLVTMAAHKRISPSKVNERLERISSGKKELINFDPKGPSPRLMAGILNAINILNPDDPFKKRESQREVIRILLSHGADPNLKQDVFDQSALHLAIMTNDYEICKLMIEYGADPFSKDIGGRTALELAYQDEFTDPNQKRIYELIKKAADKKGN